MSEIARRVELLKRLRDERAALGHTEKGVPYGEIFTKEEMVALRWLRWLIEQGQYAEARERGLHHA